MDIAKKTIVVAGGSGCLGSAIVTDLRRRGARVATLDEREPDDEDQMELFVKTDVADERSVETALQTIVAQLGNISVLVNCAGMIHNEPLVSLLNPERQRHRLSTWAAVVRSNLTATFVLAAQIAEQMAKSRTKGVIINFSSVAASGNPGQTAYAAAKAGIETMTRVWARELGPMGIRVVAVAPGFVDTSSTHAAMPEALLADITRRTPLHRLATDDDISSAVAFAIANDFITGHTIAINGGLTV